MGRRILQRPRLIPGLPRQSPAVVDDGAHGHFAGLRRALRLPQRHSHPRLVHGHAGRRIHSRGSSPSTQRLLNQK